MFIRLLLLFTIVPMVELALLIWVGGRIGVIPTIVIVASTGAIGVTAAKMQGFLIMNRIKENFARQQLPTINMIEGVMILVGGAMLLTPGLITDIAGFLFILPFSRPMLARLIHRYVGGYLKKRGYNSQQRSFSFEYHDFERGNRKDHRGRSDEDVYDISPDSARDEREDNNGQE